MYCMYSYISVFTVIFLKLGTHIRGVESIMSAYWKNTPMAMLFIIQHVIKSNYIPPTITYILAK